MSSAVDAETNKFQQTDYYKLEIVFFSIFSAFHQLRFSDFTMR